MNIKNSQLLQKIQKIGLNDKESLVYTALLELGGAYPSKIAEYTGLNRTTVYDVLLSLSVKGVVNEIEKKNKQFYHIEKPAKLMTFVQNKVALAEDELDKLRETLPFIEGLYKGSSQKPKVLYFEGAEGVLSVYEDHINVEKPYEMKAWANAGELESLLPEKFFTRYRQTKQAKNITTRGILPDTKVDLGFLERTYTGYRKEIIPIVRYISAALFPYKAEITIYGDKKVSIVNLIQGFHTGVIIEDETIHGLMSMIFELSWQAAKTD